MCISPICHRLGCLRLEDGLDVDDPHRQIVRAERLRRLEDLIPINQASNDYPDSNQLLLVLGDIYGEVTQAVQYRALKRDLEALIKGEKIEVVNPKHKPFRYRRIRDDIANDSLVLQYVLKQIHDQVSLFATERQLNRLWERLLTDIGGCYDPRHLRGSVP